MKTFKEQILKLPKNEAIKELKIAVKTLSDTSYDIDKEHKQERLRLKKEYKELLLQIN